MPFLFSLQRAIKSYLNILFSSFHQVAPLFELSQIETEVITSKGGSYIEDFLAVFRFGTIDGVLAVGGDGTFSQVVNGKTTREDVGSHLMLGLGASIRTVGFLRTGCLRMKMLLLSIAPSGRDRGSGRGSLFHPLVND